MEEAVIGFIGAVIGALAAFAGVVYVQRETARQHREDVKRATLYGLQDAVETFFHLGYLEWDARRKDPLERRAAETERGRAMLRVIFQSSRVGDDPLGERLEALSVKLREVRATEDAVEAFERFRECYPLLNRVNERMTELLHGAPVDHGIRDGER